MNKYKYFKVCDGTKLKNKIILSKKFEQEMLKLAQEFLEEKDMNAKEYCITPNRIGFKDISDYTRDKYKNKLCQTESDGYVFLMMNSKENKQWQMICRNNNITMENVDVDLISFLSLQSLYFSSYFKVNKKGDCLLKLYGNFKISDGLVREISEIEYYEN